MSRSAMTTFRVGRQVFFQTGRRRACIRGTEFATQRFLSTRCLFSSNSTDSYDDEVERMNQRFAGKTTFIVDCDGVLYHGDHLLPGAQEFLNFLQSQNKKYLFLTNSSDKTRESLSQKFARLGLAVQPSHFYTSAMSTAKFLSTQRPLGTALMIGEDALRTELLVENIKVVTEAEAEEVTPDFVVVGETIANDKYNFEHINTAVKLVRRGARLIGTNEDFCDRIGKELLPGVGSLILPIQACSGFEAYFLGKPNPLMISSAMKTLKSEPSETVMIGDRMNTDIRSGVEAGVDTLLVLSGVTALEDVPKFSYRPRVILENVGEIPRLCLVPTHT